MNMTIAGRFGMPAARASRARAFAERLRVPLEAWSVRRRWVVASCVTIAVFLLGADAWLAVDASGVQASRDALSAAQRRFSEAEAAVARLPALRNAARAPQMPAKWTSADDIRVISQLAARNDVTLAGIEPGAVTGSGFETMRPVHVTAQADFDHIVDLFEALATLPVLVVPDEVTLKRQGASLSMNATLRSFSTVHPLQSEAYGRSRDDPDAFDPDEEVVFYDPFLPAALASPAEDARAPVRLVGLLADRLRGLALVEADERMATLEQGQAWGGEQVAKVDANALTLARRDGSTHALTLAEGDQ